MSKITRTNSTSVDVEITYSDMMLALRASGLIPADAPAGILGTASGVEIGVTKSAPVDPSFKLVFDYELPVTSEETDTGSPEVPPT